jgi:hypothetical protein
MTFNYLSLLSNKDTGGKFIFAEASILTNRVFRHLPNLNCNYF